MSKLELLAIVSPNNRLAKCVQTGNPLIHNIDGRPMLEQLLEILIRQRPDLYKDCRIIRLKETWW